MVENLENLVKQLVSGQIYGHSMTLVDKVAILRKIQELATIHSYELIMPLLFSFTNKPLTLEDYRPFSPLFYTDRPLRSLVMSGRQVGKSLSSAAAYIMLPGLNPDFTSLVVTPLAEQVRRFRTVYVNPLICDSPFQSLWSGPGTKSTLYQHEFPNRSNLLFSFASLSADRIRGIKADAIAFDEIQDFNVDHLPVIQATTDASKFGMIQYTGTPKSLDNTIHGLWMNSSQAEWVTKCTHCGHWNIPSAEYDLLDMIGPWHPDISEESPGTICAQCKKPINPRYGHWQHRYPEKKERFTGYHVPQIILPLHFANPGKWRTLLEKQNGAGGMTTATFYNETLGESVDAGQKLVSLTELKLACNLPWKNNPKDPSPEIDLRLDRYQWTVISADWAGGGELGVSFTVIALMGIRPDGKIDVLWGKRMIASLDHVAEAKECLYWMNRFHADSFVHDYTGAGVLRETFLLQSGVPLSSIIPVQYVASSKYNLFTHIGPTENHSRPYFRADRNRSLLYTIGSLSNGTLNFFQYDGGTGEKGVSLMDDFLALIEEKTDGRGGSGAYHIIHNPAVPDDFAHAVNIGCLALWHVTGLWPNFAHLKPDAVQIQSSYDEDYDMSWDVVV